MLQSLCPCMHGAYNFIVKPAQCRVTAQLAHSCFLYLLGAAPCHAVDLADFGSRLAKATGGLRVKAVSWHDADGHVLWSSLPLLGIEQREAIRDALESFSGVGARLRVDRNLGDNQTAVLLRAADREGRTVGFAMLLLDSRVLLSKGRGADLPVPALQIVHEFGRLTAPRARPAWHGPKGCG